MGLGNGVSEGMSLPYNLWEGQHRFDHCSVLLSSVIVSLGRTFLVVSSHKFWSCGGQQGTSPTWDGPEAGIEIGPGHKPNLAGLCPTQFGFVPCSPPQLYGNNWFQPLMSLESSGTLEFLNNSVLLEILC